MPTAHPTDTAGALREALFSRPRDRLEDIYVVDSAGGLLGRVRLGDVLAAPAERRLEDMTQRLPPVRSDTDQELAALSALRHQITSVPVVDRDGAFLGVVPPLALLRVLHHEHVEDLHRLVGLKREDVRAQQALDAAPSQRARDRLPWLLAGVGGSLVGAWVVSQFEGVLRVNLAVAFFLPTIVYLADAIGTQTETIVVRGLSHRHAAFRRVLLGELRTGGLIGIVLAVMMAAAVLVGTGQLALAATVALALLFAGTLATLIGLTLPWTLSTLGRDPAFGSGPVATVIQDVLSLAVYLAIAALLIG